MAERTCVRFSSCDQLNFVQNLLRLSSLAAKMSHFSYTFNIFKAVNGELSQSANEVSYCFRLRSYNMDEMVELATRSEVLGSSDTSELIKAGRTHHLRPIWNSVNISVSMMFASQLPSDPGLSK